MLIKDAKGKYELLIDAERFIVYEKDIGSWTKEDTIRLKDEYSHKILKVLSKKEWFKCVDLTEYNFSDIHQDINEFTAWCVENGLFGAIIIVANEIIEMQMNISAIYSNIKFSPIIFKSERDAKNWLDSHWL